MMDGHIIAMYKNRTQQGVALLTILVMVALATILATAMIKKQQRFIKETSVLLGQGQAYQYLLAGEIATKNRIKEDETVNAATDSLTDVMFTPTPAFKVDGNATISSQLIDLSGKFNINNLIKDDGTTDTDAMAYFKRLLIVLKQNPVLADAILDWIDSNDVMSQSGAESDYYQSLDPAIQPANQRVKSITELKQVRGIDDNTYLSIAPFITALPKHSSININTASSVVLAALDNSLKQADIDQFILEQRSKKQALDNVSALWGKAAFTVVPAANRAQINTLLDVKSIYYQCKVVSTQDTKQHRLSSVLLREGAKISTLSRYTM